MAHLDIRAESLLLHILSLRMLYVAFSILAEAVYAEPQAKALDDPYSPPSTKLMPREYPAEEARAGMTTIPFYLSDCNCTSHLFLLRDSNYSRSSMAFLTANFTRAVHA